MLFNPVVSYQSSFYLTYRQHLTKLITYVLFLCSFKHLFIWLLRYHAHLIFFLSLGLSYSVFPDSSSSSPYLQMLEVSLSSVLRLLLFYIYTHPQVISFTLMYLLLTLKCISVAWTSLLNCKLECPTTFLSSSLGCLIGLSKLTFPNLSFSTLPPLTHTNPNPLFQSSHLSQWKLHSYGNLEVIHDFSFIYPFTIQLMLSSKCIQKLSVSHYLYCNLTVLKDIFARQRILQFGNYFYFNTLMISYCLLT